VEHRRDAQGSEGVKNLMPLPSEVERIDGAQKLYDWFGYWPSFHDAEILKFKFQTGGSSFLLVHIWEMTKEVTPAGFYALTKHVVVEFILDGIARLDLQDLWEHSILFDLVFKKNEEGFCLELSSSYGLSGTIGAQKLSLRITPGQPS
jgi:hypothetical protein